MRPSNLLRFAFATGGVVAACALIAGCNGAAHRTVANGSTPRLISDDAPLHGRGGTNPNAPYVVLDHRPALVARSTAATDSSVRDCAAANLDVAEVGADAIGNNRIVKLSFVNAGSESCTLGGYPDIALLDEHGRPVGRLVVEKTSATSLTAMTSSGPALPAAAGATPPAVVLPAHGEAYFQVGWTTGEGCPTISQIVISAPNTTKSFLISHPLVVCSGKIRVTSLRPTEQGMS